tara:strand:- start:399 stop:653 length:255 start_codon:yes stop_codon:yes gene_type:complete
VKLKLFLLLSLVPLALAACSNQPFENQLIKEAKERYDFAKEYGDKDDICIAAGVIKLTYLDFKDKSNYSKWKDIHKKDCKHLGI